MDPELLSRIQAVLGDAFRVERELEGGGMSRVFLADEVALARRVVVKVLPPDMAAGANGERFRREIQLAAKLQHPHIVPLLAAGSEGDLLYYVMPFIEGQSLRDRLAREGELPVGEVVRVLREVVDALAYAHERGIVHRDIKPDNVLLSGRHAVVTDFGVAKAVREAQAESSLTTMGVALGTPAYMAPEQAVADPNVDHRADLYAVGAMAYEMLTGRPPFTGPTVQAVLAAQVGERPEPVTRYRPTVPAGLEAVVLRCLEKKAADRWQRAEEILPHLDAAVPQTGVMTPAGEEPVVSSGTRAAIRRGHPLRVAALFGLAAAGVLGIVYAAVMALGLPDWVFAGAVILLAVGLPIMLLTGHHERRRAAARGTGRVAEPGGLAGLFTWRKALAGGGLAFAALLVLTTGFVGLRALGVGPFGTLLTAGVLEQQDRILLADFDNVTDDPRMGETVTELLRIDLAQSRVVTLLEPSQVGEVLDRMQRDRGEPFTPELATQVAAREGIKAFIAGEVRQVGDGYALSARLIAAGSGDAMVSHRETAAHAGELIRATERLSARLRERVGESLRTVRASPALERVTTPSLDALRLYAQAERVSNQGDQDRAITLLEQAVALDSAFAAAHRRLSAFYGNRGENEKADSAILRAYGLRDRLSERERYHVEAIHAWRIEQDDEKAAAAYLALLDRHPLDPTALNNLGFMYARLFREDEAAKLHRHAIDAGVAASISYTNLIANRIGVGQVEVADTILAVFAERYPDSRQIAQMTSNVARARREFDAAESAARELLAESPGLRQFAHFRLAELAQVRGRLADAERLGAEARRIQAERVGWDAERRDLEIAVDRLLRDVWFAPDRTALAGRVEALWARAREQPFEIRRYHHFMEMFAQVGRPARARELGDEYRAGLDPRELEARGQRFQLETTEGDIASVTGRPRDALAHYRTACTTYRPNASALCDADPFTANAYDLAGEPDSALVAYERYIAFQGQTHGVDALWFGPSLRRLAELYETRGDRDAALEHYSRFIELWQDADPPLQPLVREARDRVAELAGEPSS